MLTVDHKRACRKIAGLSSACALLLWVAPVLGWFGDSGEQNPGTNMGSGTSCSRTYWYCWDHLTNCSARGFYATWNHGFVWNGRGWYHEDFWRPGYYSGSAAYALIRAINQGGGDNGNNWRDRNACNQGCDWITLYDQEVGDLYNYNGVRVNADESSDSCKGCGSAITMAGQVHGYGDKWVYLNDWIVFGGYGTANPGAISDLGTLGGSGSFPFAESGIYVYGAIDTSHGNYFATNLYGGRVPFRVTTGDCGKADLGNYLNFKGNASNAGNNNCDYCNAYAFAWMYTPSGAGPMFGIGSDDGVRVWLNGNLFHDNNTFRGTTWDQDRTAAQGFSAGWNRVLFKVHNGGGGFSGVMSLHAGNDFRAMEGSVSLQSDRYGGYSIGYESNAWYPTVSVSSFYGISTPTCGGAFYGNITSVTASGTSAGQGAVPYWRTMQYMWGYGTTGDSNGETNYADVSDNPTNASWSDTRTGITGHRRFHFFAVSKSGRTSGQQSGSSGAWSAWCGNGAKYFDVYIDNAAPQNPSLSSINATSTSQINLGWSIPLDKGVNVADGGTEVSDATEPVSSSNNYYRRGDVGVQVYRGGSVISAWGTGTSKNDTGLSANTLYTYTIEARDNTSQTRGAWANTTGQQGSTAKYTLIETPAGLSFTSVADTSLAVSLSGTLSNLSAGNSGTYIANTTLSTNAGWRGNNDAWTSDSLTPNTQYSFSGKARNGDSQETGTVTGAKYTLAAAPSVADNVACNKTASTWYPAGTTFTFSNPAGFGTGTHGGSPYKVSKFKYAWDKSGGHSWTGSESDWSSDPLPLTPNDGDGEYYLHLQSRNAEDAATATTLDFGPFRYDGTAPTLADLAAVEDSADVLSCAANALQGTVAISVNAGDTTSGLNGRPTITLTKDGYDPLTVTYSGESPTGTFNYTVGVDYQTANDEWSINVNSDDVAGNSSGTAGTICVNKNRVTGTVSFATARGHSSPPVPEDAYQVQRTVTLVATNAGGTVLKTWTPTLTFTNDPDTLTALASYTLTDVPATTAGISAKTESNLRKRIPGLNMNLNYGQAMAGFTGTDVLPGGDVNGSNSVNVLDYALIKTKYNLKPSDYPGDPSVARMDINGDDRINVFDYLVMKASWFKVGDAP